MAKRRVTEAERLRQHNAEMKLALAENITVLEARRRLGARRWREFEAEMERRRRCGTADAENRTGSGGISTVPAPAARPQFWWDRY